MKIICIQFFLVLMFYVHTFAQEDSCEMQKEVAKNYASHIDEKDRYYLHSLLLGTFLPLVGPLAMETKALIVDVKPINSPDQSSTATSCFKDEYVKRVKVERSKEVLKGGLVGTGVSVFLYGVVLIIVGSIMLF